MTTAYAFQEPARREPREDDDVTVELEQIEDSFRADIELAKQRLTHLLAAYTDDLSEHGGDFDLKSLLERFDDIALDEFYAAKRQIEEW